MLKVRLMGTKNDIKWFERILDRIPKIEVLNKGTDKYYRVYVVIKRLSEKE